MEDVRTSPVEGTTTAGTYHTFFFVCVSLFLVVVDADVASFQCLLIKMVNNPPTSQMTHGVRIAERESSTRRDKRRTNRIPDSVYWQSDFTLRQRHCRM
jgi:hypothetical protein